MVIGNSIAASLRHLNDFGKSHNQANENWRSFKTRLIVFGVVIAVSHWGAIASGIRSVTGGAIALPGSYAGARGADGMELSDPIYSEKIQEGDRLQGYLVTSGFGRRIAPTAGASTNHLAVDLGTPSGTAVYMVGDGSVICSNEDGWGLTARIKPDDIPRTFRASHLSRCQSGVFNSGQVIARTGNTGTSTGPHLDWAEEINGNPIPPAKGFLVWALKGDPPKPIQTIGDIGDEVSDDFLNRIVHHESSGCRNNLNEFSGALGCYQFMPSTLELYEDCVGINWDWSNPQVQREFIGDRPLQDKFLRCYWDDGLSQIPDAVDNQTKCRMMSAWHYAGDINAYTSTVPQPGGYPSVAEYASRKCD
ncbi:MAG: peptidoglycan DD-metalloendopeptidase family protein [Cyanobacteria bacterium P01_E01_bin.6]